MNINSNSHTKILHITSYPPPRAGWGMRVYFLKQEMEKNGDICTVLNTGKGRFLKGRDFVPVFNGLDYFIKVVKFRLKGFTIHQHLNGDSPKGFILTLLSLTISLLTFKRPVITFHAGPVQRFFPKFKAPMLTPYYKYIFTVPKFIICNNEAVKNNIRSYGIDEKKIVPIQSFSKQYLQFEKMKLNDKLEKIFKDNFPVILCYAYFRPEFYLEYMVEAYHKFIKNYPSSMLIIVGFEEGADGLKELIGKLGLDDKIYFAGDVDHDSFLTILSRSTIYLRTPVKDGVCSSVLEALSLKVPVVASENGTRPPGVVTYENENIDQMVNVLSATVDDIENIRLKIKKPEIEDTIAKEIALIKEV